MEQKISELLMKYRTDKNRGTIDPENGHFYGRSYDEIFSWFDRSQQLRILEIGVQKGGSLKAWKEYFPGADVTGVDIVDVREKDYVSPELHFVLSDIKTLDYARHFGKSKFDIIIDDGSHFLEDVEFVAGNYLERLNRNGVMVIEDTQNPEKWVSSMNRIISSKKGAFSLTYRDMRNVGHYDDFLIIIKNTGRTGALSKMVAGCMNGLKWTGLMAKKAVRKVLGKAK